MRLEGSVRHRISCSGFLGSGVGASGLPAKFSSFLTGHVPNLNIPWLPRFRGPEKREDALGWISKFSGSAGRTYHVKELGQICQTLCQLICTHLRTTRLSRVISCKLTSNLAYL